MLLALLLRTHGSSDKVAVVVGLLAPVLADAAEEGKDIVLSMLVVGLVFLGVIALGELNDWRGRRSRR
jgi:hypothetical protein